MAIAGDVIIKLAADFAEFVSGMQASQKALDEFGKQTAETASKIDGFISTAKNLIGVLGLAALVHQLSAYNAAAHEAAAKTQDMADKLKLSAVQVQALDVLSKQTGLSVDELAKRFKGNTTELDKLASYLQSTGQTMDGSFTAAAKKAADQAEETSRKIRVLWTIMVAPVDSFIAKAMASLAQSMQIINANASALSTIRAIANVLTGGIAGAAAGSRSQIEDLDRQIRDLGDEFSRTDQKIREIEAKPAPLWSGEQAFLEQQRARRDELRQRINDISALAGQLRAGGLPSAPAINVPGAAPTGGGGGGRTDDENIDAQIRRYKALEDAAKNAAETIHKGRLLDIDDLQRSVRVQQQIDEIAAKLGAKYADADPKKKEALRDQITLYEQLKDANAKQLEIATAADEAQRRWGDGTEAFARKARDLQRELGSTRLSQEAFNRAMKEAKQSTDQAAAAAGEYDEGLKALVAGFQAAALASEKANSQFAIGQAVFNGLTGAISESLDVLVGKSQKSFGQIAADFLLMIAKMEAAAAVSKVLNLVIGAIGSAFAPSIAGAGVPGEAGMNAFLMPGLTGRQGGGDVYAGRSYWVGEHGPERFIPAAAGRIEPAGRSGGVTINNYAPGVDVKAERRGLDLQVTVQAVRRALTRDVARGGNEFASSLERTYRVARGGGN